MSQRAGRRNQPGSGETGWIILGGFLAVVLLLTAGWWGAALIDPAITTPAGASDPLTILTGQMTGTLPVTAAQLVMFSTIVFGVLVLVAFLVFVGLRQRGKSSRVDHLARSMSRPKDLIGLSVKAQTASAERLRAADASPGVPLARAVTNNKELRASWEWVQTWIMGPRAGKTSCVCVPQIVETNGPVLATSNKRDIVDLTRGPRLAKGRVWVHDPQDIIGEEPSWFWNPLSFVKDMETAQKLADVFIASETSAGASQDAYFTSDGKRLLSHLLLSAALTSRPITDVFTWANDPDDPTPREALDSSGSPTYAAALGQIMQLTPKQRDGVYGTVRPWVSVLGDERVMPWLRDPMLPGVIEFDHEEFSKTTDTLYLISREGGGSARAITAALVMATLTSAEKRAGRLPGGRLSPPVMAVLDEAANVVRWRELPDLYSHYGSRGIVVSTFFQSFVQGVEAFGKEGMRKLWSSANIRVAGSGLSEDEFLPFLSQLVGERDVIKRQTSSAQRGRSTSTSIQRERIMDVADLAGMPSGRALLFSSGQPAALMKLEHFSAKPYAQDVKDSQEYYEAILDQ
ncbi:type IV secretory system conjugative DNA transfer family protein [Nesterenkonia lutea]|uniref:Type IV secretory pathway TraG/TraD family ATPase VirD4 n=1 Tax=Nesterenkonia lutea TaxID=272919 RepID=A0ABR9JI72_9MICC|nr:type IV secretory system conjugative DNA transfer family protein [Nesterenkonia lutea]MBE1525478.1 type IV secretory pathway TraG/TraD family ATPase VirD4 [Nesterenkonia lutea]